MVSILGYSGDPLKRSTMDFLNKVVKYASGTELFLPYSRDVDQLLVFESYIRTTPELFLLLYQAAEVPKLVTKLNKQAIENYLPKDTVFLSLRVFGAAYYNRLTLPDKFKIRYSVAATVDSFDEARNKVAVFKRNIP